MQTRNCISSLIVNLLQSQSFQLCPWAAARQSLIEALTAVMQLQLDSMH